MMELPKECEMSDFEMSTELSAAVSFFSATFAELAVLFVGISFIVSVINRLLPPQTVTRLLSGNRGYAIAVGLGAVTPFCSCSTLPMVLGLIKARAAFGPVMTFLFTSPLLNPYIAGLFWLTFGARITLIYGILVVSLAILSGYLLQKLRFERFIRQELLQPACRVKSPSAECGPTPRDSCCDNVSAQPSWLSVGYQLLRETLGEFVSFMPYMIFGVAVGAVLHGYVPTSVFTQLSGGSNYWLIPVSAIMGVFLYVRASTMVPIAAMLVAKGMSMGAVMSLTIGGAGASLPEMIMMKKMFHWPLMTAFVLLVFTTACLTGFAIEFI
jgi:uncharacterized membrane protein YraQ (UPF0718 family)